MGSSIEFVISYYIMNWLVYPKIISFSYYDKTVGEYSKISRLDQKMTYGIEYHSKFLICNSCLWLDDDISIQICPTCRSEKLEFIPIAQSEAYRVGTDANVVSMEFWNLWSLG